MRICPHNRQMEWPRCPYPKCHAGVGTPAGAYTFPTGDGVRHGMVMQTLDVGLLFFDDAPVEDCVRYWWAPCSPDGMVSEAAVAEVRRLAYGDGT